MLTMIIDKCNDGGDDGETQRRRVVFVSRSSQCSTTGVTKAVVCVIPFVGWCI